MTLMMLMHYWRLVRRFSLRSLDQRLSGQLGSVHCGGEVGERLGRAPTHEQKLRRTVVVVFCVVIVTAATVVDKQSVQRTAHVIRRQTHEYAADGNSAAANARTQYSDTGPRKTMTMVLANLEHTHYVHANGRARTLGRQNGTARGP
jgi:hypothetical protein